MPESEHSQLNLAAIKTRLDNIERMVRFGIAADPNSATMVGNYLKAREGAAEIYLALAEPKSQEELMKVTRMSQGNVSKICKHLIEGDLIAKIPDPQKPTQQKYIWSDLERILKVSKLAQKAVRK